MNIEQLRAEFEALLYKHPYLRELGTLRNPNGDYCDLDIQDCWEFYQAGRAALQSQKPKGNDIMLSGVIRMPFEMAMADPISRMQFYQRAQQALNELEAMQSQDRVDAFTDGVLLGLQVITGAGNAGSSDHDELMRSAGVDLVVRRAIEQEMWELAGLDRNQISITARRRIEGERDARSLD